MMRDEICAKFLEAVPYELYPMQEEALLAWFECEGGILVCAPTGMGKTLIAEAALFEALQTRQRLYYTTPLIALTEQKFREFQDLVERWGFARDDVGFITGNRRENPNALIRVVVAEILLNHLLSRDATVGDFGHVGAVVMDEFHTFNDFERGIVWELSLTLLPPHVRVMLLSATVGNPHEFSDWLKEKFSRKVMVVTSAQRRVPLEYHWVEDKLLTELLVAMAEGEADTLRTPALVFAFNRDECWEIAEKLKGLPIITKAQQAGVDEYLKGCGSALEEGVGPKLAHLLRRGVGVHHAGVLPRHKEIVEDLFIQRRINFVCCTETLAAGINLPARSVVLTTLLKGKPRERKLIPASSAHQMFGRAGRPQFDTQGHVFATAHDDDVKINKWRQRYDQIDPRSKDPGLMRMRKDLERKRPSRRSNEQYWSQGQFNDLIKAGPAKLYSRGMIPYSVLIFLLTKTGVLHDVRRFLEQRFAPPVTIERFGKQLDAMLGNLQALGYLKLSEDGDHVTLDASIERLLGFRSIDPLYGDFLAQILTHGGFDEKLIALESVLEVPWSIIRNVRLPDDLPKGPLQEQILEPMMIAMGVPLASAEPEEEEGPRRYVDAWDRAPDPDEQRPPDYPEMLKLAFDAKLAAPEDVFVQTKWIAGDVFRREGEFFKSVRALDLTKQEGLILRHLLRLVILAGEFFIRTEDPDYELLAHKTTQACQRVDASYTEHFLADARAMMAAQKRV